MNGTRFLTFKQVRDRTGLSRSTVWRLERTGHFPLHHRISPNRVAWAESEINEWVDELIQATKLTVDRQDGEKGDGK
jgi:prophage regulatory protein